MEFKPVKKIIFSDFEKAIAYLFSGYVIFLSLMSWANLGGLANTSQEREITHSVQNYAVIVYGTFFVITVITFFRDSDWIYISLASGVNTFLYSFIFVNDEVFFLILLTPLLFHLVYLIVRIRLNK